ncbi:MAG: hypothetical protein ABFD96_24625 [Armatimonadia bacterium]
MAPIQWRKADAWLLAVMPVLLMLPSLASAQVRELGKAEGGVTLGTDRFSVTVRPSGTISNVKSGQTLLFPFISLYTTPHSTEDGAGVRACQTETPGLGDRAPEMRVVLAEEKATVEISRECSHPKVYHNAPIWSLKETVVIEPSGRLRLTYDCLFHRITRWSGLASVCAGAMPAFKEQTFRALIPGGYLSGLIPAGLPNRNDTVGLWDLTLQSTAGPVHLTFDNPGRVTLDDWTQYLAISTALPNLPHGGLYTYRGQHERFGFTIQLPVTP